MSSSLLAPDYPQRASWLGLMLDYDGTLTPIVSRPEAAFINPRGMTLLGRLADVPSIRLAIVSGRSIRQLKTFLGNILDKPITLCGLHGGEIRQYPDNIILRTPSVSLRKKLRDFKEQLQVVLNARNLLDGVVVEDKIYTLAMHYRLVPSENREAVIESFKLLYTAKGDPLEAEYRIQPGKEVLELVPAGFDKGDSVRFLANLWQEEMSGEPITYTYVGDDWTDEQAFRAVRQMNGRAVQIGGSIERDSEATIHLASIDKLYEALEALLPSALLSWP